MGNLCSLLCICESEFCRGYWKGARNRATKINMGANNGGSKGQMSNVRKVIKGVRLHMNLQWCLCASEIVMMNRT